jgi:hypothetical protein
VQQECQHYVSLLIHLQARRAQQQAAPAMQVLTPAMLHTIFRRMCDPDNPNNLAGD